MFAMFRLNGIDTPSDVRLGAQPDDVFVAFVGYNLNPDVVVPHPLDVARLHIAREELVETKLILLDSCSHLML
jgi:hypothetical protein